MIGKSLRSVRFVGLEVLLLLACAALILQLIPSLVWHLARALDPRYWSRPQWVGLNTAVVIFLISHRFRTELIARWRIIKASIVHFRAGSGNRGSEESQSDCEKRARRDAEWRERAKNRLPFT